MEVLEVEYDPIYRDRDNTTVLVAIETFVYFILFFLLCIKVTIQKISLSFMIDFV
jgi:hypothetical protein